MGTTDVPPIWSDIFFLSIFRVVSVIIKTETFVIVASVDLRIEGENLRRCAEKTLLWASWSSKVALRS